MAQRCEICNKGVQIGHNVSYSKRRTRRVFLPNLRRVKIEGKKVKICMKCLKRAKKEGKIKRETPKEVKK